MSNVTISAEDELVEAARARARSENTTLEDQIRVWLEQYARQRPDVERALKVIHRMQKYVAAGGPYTRDELNER